MDRPHLGSSAFKWLSLSKARKQNISTRFRRLLYKEMYKSWRFLLKLIPSSKGPTRHVTLGKLGGLLPRAPELYLHRQSGHFLPPWSKVTGTVIVLIGQLSQCCMPLGTHLSSRQDLGLPGGRKHVLSVSICYCAWSTAGVSRGVSKSYSSEALCAHKHKGLKYHCFC